MSTFLMLIIIVIYLGVAVSFHSEGNNGFAAMYAAYAMANVGFLIGAR